jgi:hypothetical protein
MLSNVITPFLHCQSPEQAKELLDSMKDGKLISKNVHRILFKKGLVNNLPKKYKKLMFPEEVIASRKRTI